MKGRGKKIGLVALSAVMAGSLGLSFTACSSSNSDTITVYIFCGENDRATYQNLIDTWAEEYAAQLKASDPETYGDDFTIEVELTSETDTDTYFDTLNRQLPAGNAADIIYVSPSSVQRYVRNGYVLDLTDYIDYSEYAIDELWGDALGRYAYNSEDGTIGETVEYIDGAFYQSGDTSREAGIYALPKDYSSFSYAYNANYFSDALKNAYETTVDTQGAVYEYGTTPEAGTLPSASNGAVQTSIINIGTTATYYPYNFYNYTSLEAAYEAGDPVAVASVENGGYDITFPGYPDDTYEAGSDSSDTEYDDSLVHTVYTYSEFSAMSFAVCYYITVYDSGRDNATDGSVDADDYPEYSSRYTLATWLNSVDIHGAYGNDQYDSATYYLTGWLYGNDNSIVSDDYSTLTNSDYSGDWGMNTESFIEAYTAFLAYSSDWLANMYYTESTLDSTITSQGGWIGFTSGYSVFYGYGTWDTTSMDMDKDILDYQVMATPVSDDYALYTRIKNMNYESEAKGTNSTGGTFTDAQILENLQTRQNEWGARTDSVGFGVNADVLDRYTGENEWMVDAVVSLCAYLTIDPETQVSLTYSGSQIPNYATQGEDYLYGTGDFAGIITPDSTEWDTYYAIAKALTTAGSSADDTTLVSTWLTNNGYSAYVDAMNELYTSATLGDTYGSMNYAFRIFNMSSHNYASRNLLVRMAAINNADDPCTYTYDGTWWSETFAKYEGYYLLAYNLEEGGYAELSYDTLTAYDLQTSTFTPTTPYLYVMALYSIAETNLQNSILSGQ